MPFETVPAPACPICAGTAFAVVHDGLTDRVISSAPDGSTRLVRCAECGAVRQHPRPADHAIAGLYGDYYTHGAPVTTAEPATLAGRVRRGVRNGYLQRRLGYRLQPAWPVAAPLVAAVPPLAAWVARSVRSLPLDGRLLDVGCGGGDFVAEAQSVGWDAAGIDLDPVSVAEGAKAGLDVTVEDVGDRASRLPGHYDAVTLSHVIEHVPDPIATLRHVRTLLRPGGRLWLATPNLTAEGHRAFGGDWLGLDPPRHLVLFDAPSLRRALTAAGFTQIELQPTSVTSATAYRVSHAIGAGTPRAFFAPLPPRAVRLRGRLATLRAYRDPARAEELVVIARA